jgi:hypothetical protein
MMGWKTVNYSFPQNMLMKRKGVIGGEPRPCKTYLIEITRVISYASGEGTQKKMPKLKDSKRMLLKTHVEKMSVFRYGTMLMKTNEL